LAVRQAINNRLRTGTDKGFWNVRLKKPWEFQI